MQQIFLQISSAQAFKNQVKQIVKLLIKNIGAFFTFYVINCFKTNLLFLKMRFDRSRL